MTEEEDLFLQPLWDHVRPYAMSPFSLILNYVVLMNLVCMFFTALDYAKVHVPSLRWLKRYTHQPTYVPSANYIFSSAMDSIIINSIMAAAITAALYVNRGPLYDLPVVAPTVFDFVRDIAVIMMIWEPTIWVFHRFQHTKFWYNRFHKRHHEGMTTAYTSMRHGLVDELYNIIPMMMPGLLWSGHPLSLVIYNVYFVTFGVATHSGWKLPGCDLHYLHHISPKTNYGGSSTIIDRLMGTYLSMGEYRSDKEQAKRAD
jgi:sterol desaturase/sphingolipid hydroxylase (fatty acid hydroxylase superfamily)